MQESIRTTGRRRARLTAAAMGIAGLFGAGAVTAAVYVPAAVHTVSSTTTATGSGGSGTGSPNAGSSSSGSSTGTQSGLQPSQGGGVAAQSAGS